MYACSVIPASVLVAESSAPLLITVFIVTTIEVSNTVLYML